MNESPEDVWEVRPGGMLVQKSTAPPVLVPNIRVKVKHGAIFHDIYISSQATFGDLKKQVSVRTGIHPLDQKVVYKDKERDSNVFLDSVGVKDKSKLVVVEDPVAQARRILEQRRSHKIEKAAKSISAIALQVDKLASKVSVLEGIVSKGGRVVETDVVNLIESLMNQLVKLDAIVADEDGVKSQRRTQIKRVQKHVETLDSIKMKNAKPRTNVQQARKQEESPNLRAQKERNPTKAIYEEQKPRPQAEEAVMRVNNLDFFDSLFVPSTSTPISTSASSTATSASLTSSTPSTRLDWELF